MVARRHGPSLLELLASPLGEQARALGAVGLQQAEALVAGPETEASQSPVDRAGSDASSPKRKLIRELSRAPGRPHQGQGGDLALDHRIELRGSAGPPTAARGVQPVRAVAREPLPKLVVERTGHSQLAAGSGHVAEFLSAPEEMQPKGVYFVFEGHRTVSFVRVWQQERRRMAPLALFTSGSEVYRPLRHSSP